MENKSTHAIGIDVGGTKIAAALISSSGKMQAQRVVALEKRHGQQVSALIATEIQRLLEIARQQSLSVNTVGISIPGIYFVKTGNVWAPNIVGWDNYPLLADLQPLAEAQKIAIHIDSDRACYILGETWLGAAKDCRDAIYLAIGTGIGAGIIVGGKILRGVGDIAGAVGWFALTTEFREEYRRCGCFEYYASGEGLVRVAQEYLQQDLAYQGILRKKTQNELTTRDLFAAFEEGDPLAEKVVHQAIRFWGMATANLISTFNPEVIVFGGGVFGPAVRFLDEINAEARRWAQPISMQQVKLTVSQLGQDAGLLGAGALAFRQI